MGPPGVGKSLLCRRLGALFSENDSYFEVALTRFTTPDDVFGPLSLKALREDQAKRAADGFAGGAEVVFLDEIFRARALLPALLQLLNERTWPDGSRNRPAKLVSAVAATNALRDADDDLRSQAQQLRMQLEENHALGAELLHARHHAQRRRGQRTLLPPGARCGHDRISTICWKSPGADGLGAHTQRTGVQPRPASAMRTKM